MDFLCVGGRGCRARGPASGGRGPPLRPCPLCDMLEVSGDQDSQSWVQGAAQGVVTRGYLEQPLRGYCTEVS